MRIDIGSAERPDETADVRVDFNTNIDDWYSANAVNIVADAHKLPLRDEVFDSARAGSIFFVYTGTDAIDEAIRVLKPKGELDIVVQFPCLTMLLDYIVDKAVVVHIKHLNNNPEDGSVFDVLVRVRKDDWFVWGNPPYDRPINHPRRQIV